MNQISFAWNRPKNLNLSNDVVDLMNDKNLSDYDWQILHYAFTAYTFVIDSMGEMNLSQFADRIAECYSIENPINASVCNVLRKYSK